MIRALFSGVSGMRNHQVRMDVIGNNIANVNTTGFKYSRVNFEDQVSQTTLAATAPGGAGNGRGGVNPKQVGLGMLQGSIDVVQTQGNLQTTGKVTDIALQGNGFFIESDGPQRYYSRAGTFDFDREGSLVNPATGMHVMGWAATKTLDSAGEPVYSIDHSAPLNNLSIPAGAVIPPRKTTEVTLKGNLDERIPITQPTATDPPNYFDSSTEVFDSLGNSHFVTFRFTHTGPGSWDWSVLAPNDPTFVNNDAAGNPLPQGTPKTPDVQPLPVPIPPNPAGSNGNTLLFGNNGLLIDKNPTSPGQYDAGAINLDWTLPDGTLTSTKITPNFGSETAAAGLTQFATEANAVVADQNGYTRGELTGITIDKVGVMNGVFSNGRQQLLGQLAVATFSNPGGLMKEGENNYIKTNNSGDAIVRAPGEAEAGTITSGALEMSNVDLAEQFSDMIITQRGFQANSRVITTSDEILQELINLKR
jgi:flagellar hook protein FlgE